MRVENFNTLPEAAKRIRVAVFMQEQGFTGEFDALDELCVHFVAFDSDLPTATCRVWLAEDGWHVGRLAVMREHRGKGLGGLMLQHAEAHVRSLGGGSLSLHAQCRAEQFYRKCGYAPYGEMDYDEGVEHVHMRKIFD
jgi:predicted GNAT family N-acyltransferase